MNARVISVFGVVCLSFGGCPRERTASPESPPQKPSNPVAAPAVEDSALALRELRRVPGIEEVPVWSASASQDGRTFILSNNASGLTVYGLPKFTKQREWSQYFAATAADVSADGRHALLGETLDEKASVSLVDLVTGVKTRTYGIPGSAVDCVSIAGDGTKVIAAADEVRVWELNSGEEISRLPLGPKERGLAVANQDGRPLMAVVRQPGEGRFESAIRLVDIDSKADVLTTPGPSCNQVDAVALFPESGVMVLLYSRLVMGNGGIGPPSWRWFIQMRLLRDGKVVEDKELSYFASKIARYPDGRRFVIAGWQLREWQVRE